MVSKETQYKDKINAEAIAEKELQKNIAIYLSSWFYVYPEITSDCKKRRIDLIIYHQSDYKENYPIGLEIKRTASKKGAEIASWCLQASDYTKLKFIGKNALIFIYPQISGYYLDEGNRVTKHDIDKPGMNGYHNNVNSYLYKVHGFGELQKYHDYDKRERCRLVINTNLVWDSLTPNEFNIENYLKCK
jgi:hypothetical protein